MITSISLNPSIDRTLTVERFVTGELNRVISQTDVAAGKGVNVALALSALGEESECIGFMYREGAQMFKNRLEAGGVAHDFHECEGAVRVNVKVFDRAKGEITELNQSGMPVDAHKLSGMTGLVKRHALHSNELILSGSIPPNCPTDYYAELCRAVRESGCKVFLDADGERLKSGIAAKPFLIKPNRYELELLTGQTLETEEKILGAARDCVRAGVSVVAVSLGGKGALITDGHEAWRAPGMKLQIKSTVAAGDSMIAGLAAGFSRGYDLRQTFKLGVAAASARCATPPEEMFTRECCQNLMEQIRLENVIGC